jgi:ferric-dicitrate binding protein FerR (iron transport regulator)
MSETIRYAMHLDAGHFLQVHDGKGVCVDVAQGQVWITQEGDVRDLVLRAGESWRIDRDGLTLIQALVDCNSHIRSII